MPFEKGVKLIDPDEPCVCLRETASFSSAHQMGGKHYPIGAISLTKEDWRQHFDSYWEQFESAKRRFDPDDI